MTTPRVLVVGGGIAGFALLRACDRRGVSAVLVERRAGPPAAATLGLNLPGNAVRALDDLGVSALAAGGVPVRRREYRTAKGRLLFAVDEEAFWAGTSRSACVRRGDLLALLRDAVPAASVRWGTEVTALADREAAVDVTFADGHTESFDFVVGADGVDSAVRASTLGGGTRPSVLSAESWRFNAVNPGVDCWTVWSGAHGTLLLIPVSEEDVYGYASATRGGQTGAEQRWLTDTFATFPELARRAVQAAVADGSTLYHSPVAEVRIPRWYAGRVVLIGDAAHATAPVWAQGAALAVEDALVLAELLAQRDVWLGLGADFESRRRPRVDHVRAMTDRLSRAAGLPTPIRNVVLPVLGPRTYRETYGPLKEPVLEQG